MFVLNSEAHINAAPDSVYEVITDIASYKNWNPFNSSDFKGQVEPGQKVTINAHLGNRVMKVEHRILEMQPGKLFKWCDLGLFTYFAYGERTRYLTKTDKGTHYRVELKVTGILSWLAKYMFGKVIAPGMESETRALKKYIEEAQNC